MVSMINEAEVQTTPSPRPAKVIKKLRKKASSGGVNSQQNYLDCRKLGIKAKSTLCVKRDDTRKDAYHHMNAFEVRDFLRSLFTDDTPISKAMDTKNKAFIRHCFIFNVEGDIRPEDTRCHNFYPAIKVRASRRASTVKMGEPASLLTRVLSFPSQRLDSPVDSAHKEDKKRERDNWGPEALAAYTLSHEMQINWGYPHPVETASAWPESVECLPANDTVHVDKKRKLDDNQCDLPSCSKNCFWNQLFNVGKDCPIPSLSESERFLSVMQKFSCAEIVNCSSANEDEISYYELQPHMSGKFDVVAVDCEMCDTMHGLELTRCSLLDGITGYHS